MAMIGNIYATQVASLIDSTSKVLEAALECPSDRWAVIKLSPRRAALVTGRSLNLVPAHETVLAKKDFGEEPIWFIGKPKAKPR